MQAFAVKRADPPAFGRPIPRLASQMTAAATQTFFPVDTGSAITNLIQQYAHCRSPIAVSFRDLVHWLKVGERVTHYLHPYPAKLLPHIAHFFLASRLLVDTREVVLDPFAGTGTVALETILSGRTALYCDVNPLARLITRTKTRPIDDLVVADAAERLQSMYKRCRTRRLPDVVNLEKWFTIQAMRSLARLRETVESVKEPELGDLLRVTFSAVVRKASNTDPRFSVPVRRKDGSHPPCRDVWQLFEAQLRVNRGRLRALSSSPGLGTAYPAGTDARRLRTSDGLGCLPDGSVGMVLTSPPYAGAQKYVRATSLSLGWLDLTPSRALRPLEDLTIGREHFPKAAVGTWAKSGISDADRLIGLIGGTNPLRATIVATYLDEMRAALAESVRVLRPGGHFVLVIGDNAVCGQQFATSRYLHEMLEQMGLVTILALVDPIRSRGLMTRRAATANVISHESVIILRKPTV